MENNIDLSSGSNTLRVRRFTVSGGGTGILPQNNVTVGATARVLPNQAPGVYTGVATFNIVYN